MHDLNAELDLIIERVMKHRQSVPDMVTQACESEVDDMSRGVKDETEPAERCDVERTVARLKQVERSLGDAASDLESLQQKLPVQMTTAVRIKEALVDTAADRGNADGQKRNFDAFMQDVGAEETENMTAGASMLNQVASQMAKKRA